MKHAALSKCFLVEFEKQPFSLRRRMNWFLKTVYFLNLMTMMGGMIYVTMRQDSGDYHPQSITITMGEQIWNEAIVTTSKGDETKPLMFSFFNGVYARNGTFNGRPIYVEQNKFDGSPFQENIGAQIQYCRNEKAWVFAHENIRKSNHTEESDCPWLLRSKETTEYDLLAVDGAWTIWTGSIQESGYLSAIDNKCQGAVDCNYYGSCDEGRCDCDRGYYGMHCQHTKPCSLIQSMNNGGSSIWSQVIWPIEEDFLVYERPVYRYEEGGDSATFELYNLDVIRDQFFLVYTGSRWLGTVYKGARQAALPRDHWRRYIREYHAFWLNIYNERTIFVSDPTTQSSIIGVDFYLLGKRGQEYGPFGQLYPLAEPEGSGLMHCVENEETGVHPWDIYFVGTTSDFSDEYMGTISANYELRKDRDYQSEFLAKDCSDSNIGIWLNVTTSRKPEFKMHDMLSFKISADKAQLTRSSIWNSTTGTLEFCHALRTVDSNKTATFQESFRVLSHVVLL